MSYRSKRGLLAQVAPRYQLASHRQKSVILKEFVAATGYARKYAIRVKAGALLKRQIPVRTFADWDEGVPGFLEADEV